MARACESVDLDGGAAPRTILARLEPHGELSARDHAPQVGGRVRLGELIKGLAIVGKPLEPGQESVEVEGVSHDSRRVEPGDFFVAWKGERFDGAEFADQAIGRGAVAVLCDSEPRSREVPWLVAQEPRSLLGPLASRVYGHPDRELLLVGVTGTNGKSTVVELVARILDAAAVPSVRLGTLGYRFREREFRGERTTPEASDLFRILRRAVEAGARAATMEVSSHALVQGRVASAGFGAGVFLNLTRDHLEFHGDMETYYRSKARLFDQLSQSGRAVVSVDDPWGERLARELDGAVTFGEKGHVRWSELRLGGGGIEGRVVTPKRSIEVVCPLLGRYNAENVLAAVATAEALGIDAAAVTAALRRAGPLPGRLEAVDRGQPFPVLIDYAHTPGALRAALAALRDLGGEKVMVVFGCGGERDPGKRPLMGRVAGELADYAILTSDNPRGEDPASILAAVEGGMREVSGARWETVPDRRRAIYRAVALAGPGWSLLVAGKGHERFQLLGDRRVPFVDREVVAAALEEGFGTAAIE